ncbi:hypothetical protein GDO81_021587 [Engystomops pustulosus]|uniref:L-type lectin-like domain-containing protein n=1 Tax=Engystomops pustulosus TaxID=76066 RepID=A0AAV6Z5R8_ENGPU|nr:hypothetical protein GDO81_021587 [Engystomops pustulosus]
MAMSMERQHLRALPGLCCLLLASWLSGARAEAEQTPPHRRFEYKYSFKGPYLVQADGTVPFWLHTGNAIPSADQIRITPSLKSQKGSVWTKSAPSFENWEVEVTFRVTGRGRIGADGLAIWYTAGQGLDGNVYGASDLWNGVGIFFDSFDNDGKRNSMSEALRLASGNAAGAAGYENTQHFNDIKEHLHLVKRDIETLVQKNLPHEKQKCPEVAVPSCLSTAHFFIFVAVQSVLFIGYIMYKSQQEAAAKKFF